MADYSEMGAGRKTRTVSLSDKALTSWSVNCSASARNLRKSDLGAVIFGCKNSTIRECFSKQLFGLPAPHFSYVKNISPGLMLFLFNYSERKLHGIFEAASRGQLNIDPFGWTSGSKPTLFAAQVRFRFRMECKPLNEDQFGPILANNYYEQSLFWFELDKTQTSKLIKMFSDSPVPSISHFLCNKATSEPLPNGSVSAVIQNPLAEVYPDYSKQKTKNDPAVSGGNNVNFSAKPEWSYASISKEKNASAFQNGTADKYDTMNTRIICPPNTAWSKENISATQSTCLKDSSRANSRQVNETLVSVRSIDEIEIEEPTNPEVALVHLVGNHERDASHPLFTTANYPEERSSAGVSLDTNEFSDLHALVAKLMKENSELKESHLKQNMEISFLKQELAQSKQGTQQLNKRITSLEHGVSFDTLPEETNWVSFNSHSEVEDVIYIVGGFDGSSWSSALSSYSPSCDAMKSLSPMTSIRSCASVEKLDSELFICGGLTADVCSSTVESYNPTSNRWVTRPPLNQKKDSLAAASIHAKIYVVGGRNGIDCFSEVEMLDLNVGRWICTLPMQQKRFGLAAAEVNGAIYATGGCNGRDYLKSVERFDPREPSWAKMASMRSRRAHHSLLLLNGKLYALGGYDGAKMVSTVEIFEPRLGLWRLGEPMKESRGYSGAVVMGEDIYVIGGVRDDDEISDTIEIYQKGSSDWRMTDLKGVGKRSSFPTLIL